MAELKIGQRAPKFSLTDKDGKEFSFGTAKSDYTVLYFYPKDDTPGCTLEAKEFSTSLPKFKSRNVAVVGISGGSDKTKASFCKKYSLKVPLVSDTDFKVAKSYGAYGAKKFMGRSFQGIFRKTFVVDKSGKVVKIFGSVKPEGHADEVLAVIDSLRGSNVGAAPKKAAPKKEAAGVKRRKPSGKSATKKSQAKKAPKRAPAKGRVAKKK